MQEIIEQAETLRSELAAAVQTDATAFDKVIAAYELPKDTPQEQQARNQEVEKATLTAAQIPLEVASNAVKVLELAVAVATNGNTNAITDAGTAGTLARAAMTSASLNVRVNTLSLQDRSAAQNLLINIKSLENRANELEIELKEQLNGRGGLSLV